MTREEQIKELTRNLHSQFEKTIGFGDVVRLSIQWADEHPKNPWRDAKKEPPEEYKNRRSKPVLIRYGIDYPHYDVWRYNYEKYYWENMSIYPMTAPDYWMPIPELPKGE